MARFARRRPLVPLAVCAASFLVLTSSASLAASTPNVRDVGVAAGLRRSVGDGYSIHPHDVDHDGWPDLLLGRHGGAAELFVNDPAEGTSTGFSLAYRFIDTVHDRKDRHGCAWGDVNLDGRDDLYCAKGAHGGTVKKWNELWIQRRDGSFVDRAHAYGVEDVWGRGRRVAFIDLNHDRYPDLFVGNDTPRRDGRPSPNRTFVNVRGTSFREARVGLTRETGAECVQVLDVNHDGWDDLLVCGNDGLELDVRLPRGGFEDRAAGLNVPPAPADWVRIEDVSGDGRRDLLVERKHRFTIQLRLASGRFGPVVYRKRLRDGVGFAAGDVDGVHGEDVFIVQGCLEGRNVDDVLLLNGGNGRTWTRARVLRGIDGCGDAAATIDFDRDGMADVVVINGGGRRGRGPDQLLTMGAWQRP
jgi:FG-GAP-like repeat